MRSSLAQRDRSERGVRRHAVRPGCSPNATVIREWHAGHGAQRGVRRTTYECFGGHAPHATPGAGAEASLGIHYETLKLFLFHKGNASLVKIDPAASDTASHPGLSSARMRVCSL